MSLEENIGFINDQIRTFEYMVADTAEVLDAKRQVLTAYRDRLNNINGQIRAEKETLSSDGRLPLAAAIRERMQAERATGTAGCDICRVRREDENVRESVGPVARHSERVEGSESRPVTHSDRRSSAS